MAASLEIPRDLRINVGKSFKSSRHTLTGEIIKIN